MDGGEGQLNLTRPTPDAQGTLPELLSLSQAVPSILEAIDYGLGIPIEVGTEGIPLCVLGTRSNVASDLFSTAVGDSH